MKNIIFLISLFSVSTHVLALDKIAQKPFQDKVLSVKDFPVRKNMLYFSGDAEIHGKWYKMSVKGKSKSAFYDMYFETGPSSSLGTGTLAITGYKSGSKRTFDNIWLSMICGVNKRVSRWDKTRYDDWGKVIANTFNDKDAVNLLNNAKTVILSLGLCRINIDKLNQLTETNSFEVEFHAGFIPYFSTNKATGIVMELGKNLRDTPYGMTHFSPSDVKFSMWGTAHRDVGKIILK